MSNNIPEYCQVIKVTAADGSVKELIFPKALDLNRPKRPRTTFSDDQLKILKKEFDKNPYLIGKERQKLAKELGLTETQVKVWFQNRRTKYKKSSVNDTSSSSTDDNQDVEKPSSQTDADRSNNSANTADGKLLLPSDLNSSYLPFTVSSNIWQYYSNNCCF